MISDHSEIELQKSVHLLLSDPAGIRETVSGKRLQVLSPGRLNVHKGPDFKDTAVLVNGEIIVGDAEFHRNASEWFKHTHDKNPEYDSVILHIVLNDNINEKMPFETLVLSKVELMAKMDLMNTIHKPDINSIHDLQDYALIRLLRRAVDAQKVLDFAELNDAMRVITSRFMERYNKRKRRPVYNDLQLKEIIHKLTSSGLYEFLNLIKQDEQLPVIEIIPKLLSSKIANEGSNLRQEIVLNCILPIALCLANEETRILLFLWYWSTPALNTYGLLTRRFKNIPQQFIWQQQGMLEYLKEFGGKKTIVSDAILDYGFAEVLDFYRVGRAPID